MKKFSQYLTAKSNSLALMEKKKKDNEWEKLFKGLLDKFGVTSPAQIKDKAEKDKFYKELEKLDDSYVSQAEKSGKEVEKKGMKADPKVNEAQKQKDSKFQDIKYAIWYEAPKGYFIKGIDPESKEIFKGDKNFFDTEDEAIEHAELSIEGYLDDNVNEAKKQKLTFIPASRVKVGDKLILSDPTMGKDAPAINIEVIQKSEKRPGVYVFKLKLDDGEFWDNLVGDDEDEMFALKESSTESVLEGLTYQLKDATMFNNFVGFYNNEIVKKLPMPIVENMGVKLDAETGKVMFESLSHLHPQNSKAILEFMKNLKAILVK